MNREHISDKIMGLTTFNLNLLTVFCLIYSTRSITAVSEIMGVTPPSVSQYLQKLRIHFKDPLFIRHGNSIAPTIFSEDLYTQVHKLIEQMSDSVNHIEKTNRRAELVIYSPFSLVIHDLPALLDKIKEDILPYKIKYIETNVYLPDVDELLNLRKVDVVFSAAPIINSSLKCIKYNETEFVLVCRMSNPYIKEAITSEQLEKFDFVGYINSDSYVKFIQKTSQQNIGNRHFAFETNSLMTQLLVLSKTNCLGFISKKAFVELGEFFNLRKVEPLFPVPKLDIYMTYRKDMEESQGFQVFLQTILNTNVL
ncbi:LysR family transcriptional regulator [Scandinavium goeteborgense]|uniref:DNA-binding transcriptional LysR family regulator n=1 Tax=Scandinavium goeteborgense TaxID=1851514 RepID=A0A4R6DP84_SCAGO|nr:LysR family transcriptional regulator [Scandinavium goeteborgense]TDN46826.1 DNA-binding transcriptional LysR family regulator [Scandinavium goeteborgense]